MAGSKKILGFGLAVAAALAIATFFMADQITTTSATGGGPEMDLAVTAGGDCDGDKCTVAQSGDFTLAVNVVGFPEGGYVGVTTFVRYGSDLTLNLADTAAEEVVWPDCESAVALRAEFPDNGIHHGCLTGLFPPLPVSMHTGAIVELSFTCSAGDSSTEVELLPFGADGTGTSGSAFADSDSVTVAAKTSNLTVNCGEGGGNGEPSPTPGDTEPTATPDTEPTDTPDTEPTATPTATTAPPTVTPSDQPCGDVNGDGEVSSVDSLWVLWFTADLVPELEKDGDINGDGNVNAVDAALILQIDANLYSC